MMGRKISVLLGIIKFTTYIKFPSVDATSIGCIVIVTGIVSYKALRPPHLSIAIITIKYFIHFYLCISIIPGFFYHAITDVEENDRVKQYVTGIQSGFYYTTFCIISHFQLA